MTDISKKGQSPRNLSRSATRKFEKKILEYVRQHNIKGSDKKMFADLIGKGRISDSMLASDIILRRKAGAFFGRKLSHMSQERADLQFYFWTFTHDIGNTSDREPVIELKALRKLIDSLLAKEKLNMLYVIEVQGLGNHSYSGEGRLIMLHAHGVQWTDQPFDLDAMVRRWNGNGKWVNQINATPIHIKPIGPALADLRRVANYMFKPPFDVKMAEQRLGGLRLKASSKGYRPEFAARMLELLCQLELLELVRHAGDGKSLRADLARRLKHWHKSREKWEPGKLTRYHFDELWDRFRVKKKKVPYVQFVIRR